MTPRFAVVGHVNKGKSSVIATLAEDDRVAISAQPGTTRTNAEFPVTVDGAPVFVLVDTPGFEDAPSALAWLEASDPTPDQRRERVKAFLQAFEGTDEFEEERTLLRPLLEGAGILYVVDGTKPYKDHYRAEMEILRWTGQPSMALVNRIGDGDHAEAWHLAMGQYFKVVRDFDAHTATFDERARLLTTFRELHEPWRDALQRAIDALRGERARREAEVADIVAGLLVDALTLTLTTGESGAEDARALEDEFHGLLRRREAEARTAVERLYRHSEVDWSHAGDLARPVFGEDLFAKRTWDTLGLTPTQLVATLTVTGALGGGALDAVVGGASFGTGAVIGGLLGAGAGALHLQRRFARAQSLDGLAGRAKRAWSSDASGFRVGPFANPNFPFVLLDRALLHHEAVRTRAHARNAAEKQAILPERALAHAMSTRDRAALARLFDRIRRAHDDVPRERVDELRRHVAARLRARDEGE